MFTRTRDTRSTHRQTRTHMRVQLKKPDIVWSENGRTVVKYGNNLNVRINVIL